MQRQMLSQKNGRKLASKLGLNYLTAYTNGDLPHGVIVLWTDANTAYFVRVKRNGTGMTRQYISNTKKLLKKFQVSVFQPDDLKNYCEVCGLDKRGVEHTLETCDLWSNLRDSVEQGSMVEQENFLYQLQGTNWVKV